MAICTVLISTLDNGIFKVIDNIKRTKKNPNIKISVVHQKKSSFDFFGNYDFDYFAQNDVLGLSKSRNFALECCNTDYAYIMDDDVEFDMDKIMCLVNRMKFDNVDIATCCYNNKNGTFPKKYKRKTFDHNIYTAAKVSSIEICVNVSSIRKKGIRFDERFGLGADLPSGEEYIFLADCLSNGLKVKYYPIVTCCHSDVTSGMDFFTSANKSLAKREMLKRIFGKRSYFFIFLFWLKKMPFVIKKGYFISFTKAMLLGVY